jgi:Ca2+-binding EF-hand superfamily protein
VDNVKVVGGKIVSKETTAKAVTAKAVTVEDVKVDVKKEVLEPPPQVKQEEPNGLPTVGVVVVQGESTEHLTSCTTKALARIGLTKVVVINVPNGSMLVPTARKLLNTTGIAGVLALNVAAPHQHVQASNQEGAILHLSNISEKPIIPGVVCQSSKLEANGVIPNLAEEWATAMAGLLAVIDYSHEAVIESVEVVPLTPSEDETDPDKLLNIYREALKAHGALGIFGLQRKFKIIDDDNSKSISFDEFSKAISEAALKWSGAQKRLLFDRFDKDKNGTISFDEFLCTIRGVLNERRQTFVLMAFEILDADKSGVIDSTDISRKYDASKHPDVISGKRTQEEILGEFLNTFDGVDKNGKVTYAEFSEYYANLSASIDDDDYFELMMRNAWHMSGGDGWCTNTSCRRVLVTHSDGRQTVEEIKNDIGISEDDAGAILANLVAQNLNDLTLVEFNSGKKIVVENVKKKVGDSITDGFSESSGPMSPTRRARGKNNNSLSSTIVLG